jgi:hypothetical protein
MRQNMSLDTAEFQDFDAVHACSAAAASGRPGSGAFRAGADPACDPSAVLSVLGARRAHRRHHRAPSLRLRGLLYFNRMKSPEMLP